VNLFTEGKPHLQVPARVLDKFWNDIDADGSGEVNFMEFASWYIKFFSGGVSPMEHYYTMIGSGMRKSVLADTPTAPSVFR